MSLATGKRLFILAVMVAAWLITTASAESKARIVRLSDVQGGVQMDRGGGQGFEKAFLNMPLIEGTKLKTSSSGRAEVEFEDGSTLRIVSDSEVNFTALSLGDDGQKVNTIELVDGTAYVNVRPKKGDRFTLNFGHESATLTEPAHFRVDLDVTDATVAVFNGNVHVTGRAGDVQVATKHSVTFDLGNNDKYAEKKGFDEMPYDKWDTQQSEYQNRYASNNVYGINSPYTYGLSDLAYYGSYSMLPGCGWGWQPYFMDANWNPFMDGAWTWYPGSGYMWVSAYPWGWMPYMYGNWAYGPGCGWYWQPGYWGGWNGVPRVVNPPRRIHVPMPPVRTQQTVMVGHGLTAYPASGIPRHLSIAPGSVGLAVPRGSVSNLDRVAKEMGTSPHPVAVNTEAEARRAAAPPAPPMSAGPWGRGVSSGAAPGRSGAPRESAPVRMPAPAHTPPPSARPPR